MAENVRDFVDEWVVSLWAEAKDWSADKPALARVHARLHPDHYPLLDEFTSIQSCGNGLTQVEIGADQGSGWFFLVRGGEKGPWILERVAQRAAAGCTGPDILAQEPARALAARASTSAVAASIKFASYASPADRGFPLPFEGRRKRHDGAT